MPQILHSLIRQGVSFESSKQLYGQVTTHAPQLIHLPVATTLFAKDSSKLLLVKGTIDHLREGWSEFSLRLLERGVCELWQFLNV
jgi:hypothetical protein